MGRRNKQNTVQNLNITVQTVNQQIIEAQRAEEKAKSRATVIDDRYKHLAEIEV